METECDVCKQWFRIVLIPDSSRPATFAACPYCGRTNQIPPGKILSAQEEKEDSLQALMNESWEGDLPGAGLVVEIGDELAEHIRRRPVDRFERQGRSG